METPDTKEYTGKITRLDDKGYGFISSRDIPFTRIFFHWSALQPNVKFLDLQKNQEVKFQTRDDPDKGVQAVKIKLV